MTTTTDLVQILRELPAAPAVEQIIRRAKRGYYHDFQTPIATPKMALVEDLRTAGLDALADRVVRGDFDEFGRERPGER